MKEGNEMDNVELLIVLVVIGVPLIACLAFPWMTLLAGIIVMITVHPFAGFFVLCLGMFQLWIYLMIAERA